MKFIPRDLELEKRMDDYLHEKLNEDQVIDLWVDLFDQPIYLELLETELILKALISRQVRADREYDTPIPEERLFLIRNTGS